MSKYKVGERVYVRGKCYRNIIGDEAESGIANFHGEIEKVEMKPDGVYYAYTHDLEGNIFWSHEDNLVTSISTKKK